MKLRDQIALIIRSTLAANDGCISQAARDLGICRSSLQRHLRKMGVAPISPKPPNPPKRANAKPSPALPSDEAPGRRDRPGSLIRRRDE